MRDVIVLNDSLTYFEFNSMHITRSFILFTVYAQPLASSPPLDPAISHV